MEPAAVYKQRGAECEQMATEATEPWAKEALRELAADFRALALELSDTDSASKSRIPCGTRRN